MNSLMNRIYMNKKIRYLSLLSAKCLLFVILVSCSVSRTKIISIIESTDIHGVILPYDFIEKKKLNVSMASSYDYIKKIRTQKDGVVLLDNGDNLQEQPEVYYYNYIDTASIHFMAESMNFMGYDAGTVGNHDIETGHSVYDRLVREYHFPLLAANAVNKKTGKPYFNPYKIIVKDGIKIVVFGMVTPAIPTWLPEQLYSGIEFKGMVETAEKWMPVMLKEKPDLIVGLFHSGWDRSEANIRQTNDLNENGSAAVAYNVPGFDIIFNGHDHKVTNEKFVNSKGDTVLILDGGSRSEKLAEADISFGSGKGAGKKIKKISGSIINVADYAPDNEFIDKFSAQNKIIDEYVNRVIGTSSATISSREAYFGPSAFVDMIHRIQLEITGADISFAAPLSRDVSINKGPITVGDMFKLYRFENFLYTMAMSGEEVQKYIEYSYAGWINTMKGPDDLLLKLRKGKDGKPVMTNGKAWFRNQSYNFDSAAGINYIVDASKPEGSRITITGFSDGRIFERNKTYKVAVNSYRGNGGGGHFTEGAGIPQSELRKRLIKSTDRDLRYYILRSIEEKKSINPEPLKNWKIIPEMWVKKAESKEYTMLFGTN
jgi:2',3'-cyclic-nucleotide 2'-phosphodiesterase / 3'-nucleotidase